MDEILSYLIWYICIAGTGVYCLSNSIGTRGALPKTTGWNFLWFFQLLSGLAMLLFPFVHLWFLGHGK